MILLAALLFLPNDAMAVSKQLETACASDYAAYCSPYKVTTPPSASLTACMRSHRHQLLEKCIAEHHKPDNLGDFIKWLSEKKDVYGYVFSERWFDVGDMQQLKEADQYWSTKMVQSDTK